ncbi:hypothetical protein GTR02_22095, partial [Kineococcus sp. R8]
TPEVAPAAGASPFAAVAADPFAVEAPASVPLADPVRQRSELAAEAAADAGREPGFTPATGDGLQPLVRREAGATAPAVTPVRQTAASRQRRAPADVRSMLSGFQAGVSRGRTEQGSDEAAESASVGSGDSADD